MRCTINYALVLAIDRLSSSCLESPLYFAPGDSPGANYRRGDSPGANYRPRVNVRRYSSTDVMNSQGRASHPILSL